MWAHNCEVNPNTQAHAVFASKFFGTGTFDTFPATAARDGLLLAAAPVPDGICELLHRQRAVGFIVMAKQVLIVVAAI